MEMIKISQVLKLLLIASLLIVTPLLSTSLRTTYLYFIVHLLIISLGAEAGLISSSKSPNDKKLPSTNIIIPTKQHNMTTPMIVFPPSPGTSEHQETASKAKYDHIATSESPLLITTKNSTGKVVEKCASGKFFGVAEVHEQVAPVKKYPPMPSLFFIGSTTGEEINEVEEILKEKKYDEEVVVLRKQELFYKADTFIGNFYKQLKMQREDSWKNLHDFYHKAAF